MLEAIVDKTRHAIACDDYIITRAYNGQDSIRFSLSRRDPAAMVLSERLRVYETTGRQTYLVSAIDAGQSQIQYVLKKDLSDWETVVYPGYSNGSRGATAQATIQGVLPQGWTLKQQETDDLTAAVALQGPTALDVVEQCREVYGCALSYDNETRTATLHFPGKKTLGKAFLVETANLRQAPEYKSKAGGIVTRLYAQGAQGVDFSAVNGGKPYVECFDYTQEVVAGFWRDDRYTIPEHLLRAAREKVKVLSQAERSWSLRAADLHGVDPAAWPDLALGLYDVVMLIDGTLGQRMEAQITELRLSPHHPEQNEISVETRSATARLLGAALKARRQQDGLYQDLVMTVDQVRRDLGVTSGSVENIRLAADAAGQTARQIADGTYNGGAFIDQKRLTAPEIYARELNLVNGEEQQMPTMRFYPKDKSQAKLELSAAGNSRAGYCAQITTPTDLLLKSDCAVVIQPGDKAGPSGCTGVAVEGDAAIYGNVSIGGETLGDFVVETGSSDGWQYRKWSRGQAELYAQKTVTPSSAAVQANGYTSNTLSVALPFSLTGAVATANADNGCSVCAPEVSGSTLKFYLSRPGPISGKPYTVQLRVTGAWK